MLISCNRIDHVIIVLSVYSTDDYLLYILCVRKLHLFV